jgi:predicted nucleic acid-binding protein
MARTDTLVDADPMVAYFNRRDAHHTWAKQQMTHLQVPLYTCEAVLSESFHLLEDVNRGTPQFLEFLDRGVVEVSFSYAQDPGRVHDLMRTYTDQPMSFADACLVCMAEEQSSRRIPTAVGTDDDFRVYRTSAGEPLDVLLPDT